jgi:hypothetical protein
MISFYRIIGNIVQNRWSSLVVLDAVADLLTDHATTRVRHRQAMNAVIQDEQRIAREAHAQGVLDERDRHDMWGPDR